MLIQIWRLLIFISFLSLSSCQPDTKQTTIPAAFSIEAVPGPEGEGGESHLWADEEGRIRLSWVAYINDTTDALYTAAWQGSRWSAPQLVAQGHNWFVNWADFPSVVSFPGQPETLAAHWLQLAGPDTYDYDVKISLSSDGGKHWSKPLTPHRDSILAEHGFVSLLPLSADSLLVVWLDGRFTKGEGHGSGGHSDHGGQQGAMTLRAAVLDRQGGLHDEVELDHRICDCCQTSAALTDQGPVVVYRDRSEHEVRDMSIVRRENGKWTAPKILHPDNWTIAGCPVNGPAITAQGSAVAVTWFTQKNNNGIVFWAFSADAGKTFGPPLQLSKANAIGRVDIAFLPSGNVLVSWIESTGGQTDEAAIMLAEVNPQGQILRKNAVLNTKSSRQSGFPRLAVAQSTALLSWTQADSITQVKVGKIKL